MMTTISLNVLLPRGLNGKYKPYLDAAIKKCGDGEAIEVPLEDVPTVKGRPIMGTFTSLFRSRRDSNGLRLHTRAMNGKYYLWAERIETNGA